MVTDIFADPPLSFLLLPSCEELLSMFLTDPLLSVDSTDDRCEEALLQWLPTEELLE